MGRAAAESVGWRWRLPKPQPALFGVDVVVVDQRRTHLVEPGDCAAAQRVRAAGRHLHLESAIVESEGGDEFAIVVGVGAIEQQDHRFVDGEPYFVDFCERESLPHPERSAADSHDAPVFRAGGDAEEDLVGRVGHGGQSRTKTPVRACADTVRP